MPLEELLALYGNLPDNVAANEDDDEDDDEEEKETESENAQSNAPESTSTTSQLEEDKLTEQHLKFINKIEPLPVSSNLSRLISTNEDALYEISDEEDDEDDTPEDNWRRTIQIGQDYQAVIPDSVLVGEQLEAIDSSVHANCLLLWNPKELNEREVEIYLKSFLANSERQSNCLQTELRSSTIKNNNEISSSTNQVDTQRDDELALYVLLKNSFIADSALDSKGDLDNELINLFTFIRPWSEDDCSSFEDGLRVHGKDFHQIQKNKLTNKTVNELVNFYYLWKKTERHDVFASKFKFEKRKYSLNPTITDLMDHFLDDNQPQQTSFNSTSSSLNSSLNNAITHSSSKHHSSPLTLLPTSNHVSNHLRASLSTSTIEGATTTSDNLMAVTTTVSNDLTSTSTINNIESNEDNSNPSTDSQTSKLIINEMLNAYEDEDQSEFVSSSISRSIKTTPIKVDLNSECSISSTLANNDLTTTTTNASEL